MGDAHTQPFQLSFNPRLRVEFQVRVTSGGLLLVRELDERSGLSDLIARHLTDPRGPNTQSPSPIWSGSPSTGGWRGTRT